MPPAAPDRVWYVSYYWDETKGGTTLLRPCDHLYPLYRDPQS